VSRFQDGGVSVEGRVCVKGALQVLSERYGYFHFAQVSERILTIRFVV